MRLRRAGCYQPPPPPPPPPPPDEPPLSDEPLDELDELPLDEPELEPGAGPAAWVVIDEKSSVNELNCVGDRPPEPVGILVEAVISPIDAGTGRLVRSSSPASQVATASSAIT